ncbi:MAG: tetratricopeptide repeat-containing sensor histidine kinase [Chloroherpetonaceae bacterium]|nr:tetratricopeptide repeat-containing sensor histidine kinase [Chloroherpetonaceae bacterium]
MSQRDGLFSSMLWPQILVPMCILPIFFLFMPYQSFAQTDLIDSLQRVIPASKDTLRVRLMLRLSAQYDRMGETKKADSLARVCEQESIAIRFIEGEIDSKIEIAKCQSNLGENKTALEVDLQALRLAEKNHLPLKIATASNAVGIDLWLLTRYDEAAKYLYQSIALQDSLGNKTGKARALNNLGLVLWNQGNLGEAKKAFLDALIILEELGPKAGVAYAVGNLGNIERTLKRYNEALVYYRKALAIQKETKNAHQEAQSLYNIGFTHLFLKNFEFALDTLKRCYLLAEKIGDKRVQIDAIQVIGNVYEEIGNLNAALDEYKKALSYESRSGNKHGMGIALRRIASVYQKQNKLSDAIVLMEMAIDTAASIGNNLDLKNGYEEISTLYSKAKRYEKAIEALKLSMAYRDSIFNAESDAKTTQLRELYEFEKKQREISLLEEINLYQKKEAENERLILIGLIILIISAFITTVIFYLQTKKNNQILSEKNKVISSQNDLLRQQQSQLIETNQLKDEILTFAAHDLKNPIQNILGFSVLLQNGQNEDSMIFQMAKRIEVGSKQMVNLINELLQSPDLDVSRVTLPKESLNISQMLAFTKEKFFEKAKENGIQLHLMAEEQLLMFGDRERIQDVFDKVIENAVKYSSPKSAVWIEAKKIRSETSQVQPETNESIQILIRDEGIGLDEKESEMLFSRFHKGAGINPNSKEQGFSLSIAKQIVKLHHGSINAFSEGKGKGTTIIVEFPISDKRRRKSQPSYSHSEKSQS